MYSRLTSVKTLKRGESPIHRKKHNVIEIVCRVVVVIYVQVSHVIVVVVVIITLHHLHPLHPGLKHNSLAGGRLLGGGGVGGREEERGGPGASDPATPGHPTARAAVRPWPSCVGRCPCKSCPAVRRSSPGPQQTSPGTPKAGPRPSQGPPGAPICRWPPWPPSWQRDCPSCHHQCDCQMPLQLWGRRCQHCVLPALMH